MISICLRGHFTRNLGIEEATKFGKRENKAGRCIVKMVVSGDRWVPVCSVARRSEIGWQRIGSRYTMLSIAPYVVVEPVL